MSHAQNIGRIRAIHYALEELAGDVVYVGGATVSLYGTRPGVETRPTDDIDIVVELANYAGFAALEEKLRSKGFVNDIGSGVICRYKVNGVIVDVMPTASDILGFANKWYPESYENSVAIAIDERSSVRIFSAPYFLATKFEAFADRGKNDGRFSTDFEDIVFVLNNRATIWNESNESKASVREYLKAKFRSLLDNKHIHEWIGGHLEYSEQSRVGRIMDNMREFVALV